MRLAEPAMNKLEAEGFVPGQFVEPFLSQDPLPRDHFRSDLHGQEAERARTVLAAEASAELRRISASRGCRLETTILAAFTTLIHRVTEENDVLVRLSIQEPNGNEDGPIRTAFSIRSHAESNPAFATYLESAHKLVVSASANPDRLYSGRLDQSDREWEPLFSILSKSEDDAMPQGPTGFDSELLAYYFPNWGPGAAALSNFCLGVIEKSGGIIEVQCGFVGERAQIETVQGWLEIFQTLVKSILGNPQARIWELPTLTEFERATVVVEWNRTAAPFPNEASIPELFEVYALQTPAAVAVEHRELRWTYSQLNERANRLAHLLRDAGATRESLIGICLERSPEMIAGMLAILKAGSAYVPIDPEYPDERCVQMLANVSLVLTSESLVGKFSGSPVRVLFHDDPSMASASGENLPLVSDGSSLAYVIYTSGSSGRPKGVAVEHRGVVRLLRNNPKFISFDSSDKVAQILNLAFDASVQEVWGALLNGARLVMIDKEIILSPSRFVQELERCGITILNPPTALLNLIVSQIPGAFAKLRYVVFGGEMGDPRTIAAILKAGPPKHLINAYGPTETTVAATTLHIKTLADGALSIPIGSPICNTTVYVLDRLRNPVPIGVVGELYIGGPGVARGYIDAPELTAERFIPDPFSTEPPALLYKSGDLAKWLPNGNLEFVGRVDFQVKIRGFRIEPGEIEAIVKLYPPVQDAVIAVRESEGHERILVAFVTGNLSQLSEPDLRDYLRAHLPQHMIPAAMVFVEKFPLNANGKVDRLALSGIDISRSSKSAVPARNQVEKQLVEIWQKVLNFEPIGVTDDFFELGGHSLTAVRIFSEIEGTFDKNIPFAALSEASTIEKLAKILRPDGRVEPEDPVDRERNRSRRSIRALAPMGSDFPHVTSYSQQRIWFIDQLVEESFDYNLPFGRRIRGKLNVTLLERSFSCLIRRHEMLRATFRTVDGEPMQFIGPPWELSLPVRDLRGLTKAERDALETELINEAAWTPFRLASGPLIRAKLLRTGEVEHVLIVSVHHIIFDHWSDQIFNDELMAIYQAYLEDREPELPEIHIQYTDYARWQRESFDAASLEKQLDYWRGQLHASPILQLPTDRPRSPLQQSMGGNEPVELPVELADRLKELSKSEKATFFMAVLAAFKMLLARHILHDDIVVGVPIADRRRAETAPLIGFFLNTLVLRTNLAGNPTFRELLRRVRSTALEAYRHQDIPFDLLVGALAPERDLSQNPLFQVAFVLVDDRPEPLPINGLRFNPVTIEDRTAKFDLTLMLFDGPKGLSGHFNYNAALFDKETMRRMASHFQTLLEGIVANPDRGISDIAMLTAEENQQLIVDWNQTSTEFPRGLSIIEIFEHRAKRSLASVAIEHGPKSYTYGELNERANQIAHLLMEAGARPKSLIGICMERSSDLIAGIVAILKAGSIYVPINPEYPAERRSRMLEGVSLLLTTGKLLAECSASQIRTISVDDLDLEEVSKENPAIQTDGESTLAILYTSGSTGQPKGVAIAHRAVTALVLNTNYIVFEDTDAMAFRANIGFDVALFEIWGPLLNGLRLIVIDHEVQLSPATFVSEMAQHQVTILFITTSLFHLLARELPTAFSGLRYVFVGGEILDPDCVRSVLIQGPPRRLVNVYGPTETTAFSTSYEIRSVPENAKSIPIGKPIANTRIYLLDRNGKPVPIGVFGEIHIGGAGVAHGYINSRELTESRFLPDPFSVESSARIYQSGDLGRWLPDGSLEFAGRSDLQIKIRGFRIELTEIEAALKQFPRVQDAVVIVQERDFEDKRLIAYVVGERSADFETDLQDFLRSKLPDYMVPSVVVALKKFPLNQNGKVDRRALPMPIADSTKKEKVLPRDPIEIALAAIWEKILGVKSIGVTDNFFELGGHSLLAVRIFLEIERKFGKSLPLASLFAKPTIEKLADRLRDETVTNDWRPLVAIQPYGSRPPFFGIHGRDGNVLFYRKLSDHLGIEQPFYALQSQGLDGKPMLRTSVEAIADYYVEEIRHVQPHGPYLLGGFSFGGVAAYEIARRFIAAGEKVALLVLFDTYNPANPPRLRSVAKRVRTRISDPKSITLNRFLQFLARRVKGKTAPRLLKLNEILHRLMLGGIGKHNPNVSMELVGLHVRMVHERAFLSYRPLPIEARVTLFRPTTHPAGYEFEPDLGWKDVAKFGVGIHIVPGDHDTIFLDEGVGTVAEKLKDCIHSAISVDTKA